MARKCLSMCSWFWRRRSGEEYFASEHWSGQRVTVLSILSLLTHCFLLIIDLYGDSGDVTRCMIYSHCLSRAKEGVQSNHVHYFFILSFLALAFLWKDRPTSLSSRNFLFLFWQSSHMLYYRYRSFLSEFRIFIQKWTSTTVLPVWRKSF